LPSPPPVTTPYKVKQLKAKPADSALAVVPPTPPAETAKLMSPLDAAGSKKGTADAAKSTVGAIDTISDGVSVNAVVNGRSSRL
jgi:hypothetical protein